MWLLDNMDNTAFIIFCVFWFLIYLVLVNAGMTFNSKIYETEAEVEKDEYAVKYQVASTIILFALLAAIVMRIIKQKNIHFD
jgi:hypothetical protein